MKEYTLQPIETSRPYKIDYQKELNQEQYKVVTQSVGPCLVLAGAGSGKTRVLVYRVAYLLENGVRPDQILLVTFTNKAAREMIHRIEVLLGEKPKNFWGGTFHHIGNRLLRQYGQAIGLKSNFNILDEEDSKKLIKLCLAGVSLPRDKYFPKAELIRKIISLSVNLNQPLDQVIKDRFSHLDSDYQPIIDQISQLYQKRKKESNALDYDDLLSQWRILLFEHPALRERLSQKFKYILVDEYQDTNYIQAEIIRLLAAKDHQVLVVGDDSQSIYSFRGADVNNILSFPKDFSDCRIFKLETNYRSTPEILALANESISQNRRQFEKKLRTNKPSGSRPALVPLDDQEQQASFIGQRILDLERDLGLGFNQVAILFRAHYQSLELELELNKRHIPYVMRGGLRFFEQAHLKDVLAYLRILVNPRDEVSWQRILLLRAGIGLAFSQKIWQKIVKLNSLPDVINYCWRDEFSGRILNEIHDLCLIFKDLMAFDSAQSGQLVRKIIQAGYDEYLKNNYENYSDRLADLEQLAIFAGRHQSLADLLSEITLAEGFKGERVADRQTGDGESVILTTIHQAKGLEWPIVFVIGLVESQFPNPKSLARPSDLEEERRLFYVAVTRAQEQLYLTYPLINYQTNNFNQPSPFIRELPDRFYEDWRVKEEISAGTDELTYVPEEDEDVAVNFWRRVMKNRRQ